MTTVNTTTPDLMTEVIDIWAQLLGFDDITGDDDFYELGGFSILAVQVVTRIRETLGLDVDVRLVLDHPVLSDFVSRLQALQPDDDTALPAEAVTGRHPVTLQQRSMLALLDGPGHYLHYDLGWVFTLDGAVDADRLHRALTVAAELQPALRTRLIRAGDGYAQLVAPAGTASFRRAEWTASGIGGVLDQDLFGCELKTDEAGRCRLHLRASHALFDGWSLDVLLRTIEAAYEGREPAAALELRYSDYARWQADLDARGTRHDALGWWRDRLAGYQGPKPWLAGLRSASGAPGLAESVRAGIGTPVMEGVRRVARTAAASPFHVLLAAYLIAARAARTDDDLIVGSSTASRYLPELANTIGYIANGRLTRAEKITGTAADLVEHCRAWWFESNARAEVHMEELVDLSGNPDYFDMKFSLQDAPGMAAPSLRLGDTVGALSATIPPRTSRRAFDMSATLQPDGSLALWALYRSDTLTPSAAQALCRAYADTVEAMVHDPTAPVEPLLDSATRALAAAA
ncbi:MULTISPECIES: condensation domain-containing protein [unclassified Streptomyces]|uniref:condensation domain-containing protein n=1 Tax=unclassified Streptomyces TaxID=2593676 RepID=UPI00087E7729|nr:MULTISPECIES: condensation domain-containing protein [unclassified Streptomyces]PBC82467.1 condensation domain-containing protein [Streptomyces sp. 2321.6]SDR49499.1 Condensation domain-containing protein [Streptomyces sp. KS_16]SEC59079.1 Condensation domain-containing protein [Streptomyces sp. 2133.1]SNC68462.1 Condensation domain-containing protein [Streptomyces sp. 2114.4]